jgi:hypothetical protein
MSVDILCPNMGDAWYRFLKGDYLGTSPGMTTESEKVDLANTGIFTGSNGKPALKLVTTVGGLGPYWYLQPAAGVSLEATQVAVMNQQSGLCASAWCNPNVGMMTGTQAANWVTLAGTLWANWINTFVAHGVVQGFGGTNTSTQAPYAIHWTMKGIHWMDGAAPPLWGWEFALCAFFSYMVVSGTVEAGGQDNAPMMFGWNELGVDLSLVQMMEVMTTALTTYAQRVYILQRGRAQILVQQPSTTLTQLDPDGTLDRAVMRYSIALEMLGMAQTHYIDESVDVVENNGVIRGSV